MSRLATFASLVFLGIVILGGIVGVTQSTEVVVISCLAYALGVLNGYLWR